MTDTPVCKACGKQTAGGEFCCGGCEVQWRIHERYKERGAVLRCDCERCRSINHTIKVIGGWRE